MTHCPKDKSPLSLDAGYLVCAGGHAFRVEEARTNSGMSRETGLESRGTSNQANSTSKLIRQSSRGPNKTEAAFENEVLYWRRLRGELLDYYEHEAIPLRLANGVKYNPDFPAIEINPAGGVRLVFFEVKGEQRKGKVKPRDDATVKIKTAAAKFTHFRFVLVWREGGRWQEQEVKS